MKALRKRCWVCRRRQCRLVFLDCTMCLFEAGCFSWNKFQAWVFLCHSFWGLRYAFLLVKAFSLLIKMKLWVLAFHHSSWMILVVNVSIGFFSALQSKNSTFLKLRSFSFSSYYRWPFCTLLCFRHFVDVICGEGYPLFFFSCSKGRIFHFFWSYEL